MPFHDKPTETLDREGILRVQNEKLRAMLDAILPSNAFYAEKCDVIAGRPLRELVSRLPVNDGAQLADALAQFPFTTRAELQSDQSAHPPFGRKHTYPLEQYTRFHQTSGSMGAPLRCLDRAEDWIWWQRCWHTIYRAAGLTERDRFVFPFSFGPFIGFWAAFESAASMGALCLPAGGMTTTARLQYILENEGTVICCTPTYALRMAEVAQQEGIDLASSSVRALVVAGEPGGNIPTTRTAIETAWGARVFDHAGMTEMGAYAFECVELPGGLHINESEFIAEIRNAETGETSDAGDGELILTNLGRWGMPLIRYRTGDHVSLKRGQCACGRHYARLEGGILGRIDDMIVVRGNNVFPSAIEAILRNFSAIAEFRLEVTENRAMSELRILIEPSAETDAADLLKRVTATIRDRLNFRPRVETVNPGTLPRFEMKAQRLIRKQPDA